MGLAHIGIRVHDMERSARFYALLGFTLTASPIEPSRWQCWNTLGAQVEHSSSMRSEWEGCPNILMDVPRERPGITHFALSVRTSWLRRRRSKQQALV